MNQQSGLPEHPHANHPIALEFPATIAVIGAGPIGLEATLYGRFLGYDVTLFEAGDVADNVRQWQHLPMWTPFRDLHSRLGRMAIETQNANHVFPEPQQEVNGEQWLRQYLLPLAETDLIAQSLRTRHRVLSVSRCHYSKHQLIPNETRWQDGFVVAWEDGEGVEHRDTFDFVLDTSGTFQHQQAWGVGGSPALGESQLRVLRQHDPALQAALHLVAPNIAKEPARWKDSKVLVLGDSPQAAETVTQWKKAAAAGAELLWAIPSNVSEGGLFPTTPADPLPARDRLFRVANVLIEQHRRTSLADFTRDTTRDMTPDTSADAADRTTPVSLQVFSNTNLAAIKWNADSQRFHVRLTQWFDVDWETAPEDFEEPDDVEVELEFEQIVVAVGHRVAEPWASELIVPRCPRTEAMLALVQPLLAHQGERLDFQFTDPTWTLTPEGRYFVLGAKSFGRLPNYFHRLGLQQVRDAFRWIVGRATLDVEQTLRG
jgi:hypothetical protein